MSDMLDAPWGARSSVSRESPPPNFDMMDELDSTGSEPRSDMDMNSFRDMRAPLETSHASGGGSIPSRAASPMQEIQDTPTFKALLPRPPAGGISGDDPMTRYLKSSEDPKVFTASKVCAEDAGQKLGTNLAIRAKDTRVASASGVDELTRDHVLVNTSADACPRVTQETSRREDFRALLKQSTFAEEVDISGLDGIDPNQLHIRQTAGQNVTSGKAAASSNPNKTPSKGSQRQRSRKKPGSDGDEGADRDEGNSGSSKKSSPGDAKQRLKDGYGYLCPIYCVNANALPPGEIGKCFARFDSAQNVWQHLKSAHKYEETNLYLAESENGTFLRRGICKPCWLPFERFDELKEHVKCHPGDTADQVNTFDDKWCIMMQHFGRHLHPVCIKKRWDLPYKKRPFTSTEDSDDDANGQEVGDDMNHGAKRPKTSGSATGGLKVPGIIRGFSQETYPTTSFPSATSPPSRTASAASAASSWNVTNGTPESQPIGLSAPHRNDAALPLSSPTPLRYFDATAAMSATSEDAPVFSSEQNKSFFSQDGNITFTCHADGTVTIQGLHDLQMHRLNRGQVLAKSKPS